MDVFQVYRARDNSGWVPFSGIGDGMVQHFLNVDEFGVEFGGAAFLEGQFQFDRGLGHGDVAAGDGAE